MYSFFLFPLSFYNIDWVPTHQDESESSTLLPKWFFSQDYFVSINRGRLASGQRETLRDLHTVSLEILKAFRKGK